MAQVTGDVLRRAAALMREDAIAMQEDGDWVRGLAKLGRRTVKGLYFASWHPAVALAVADWLDAEAAAMDSIAHFNAVTSPLVREDKFTLRGAALTVSQGADGSLGIQADTSRPALAVARAYLGESE